MNIQIMIVSFKHDFPYLQYALRSVKKFASGFSPGVVVVPCIDFDEAVAMVRKECLEFAVRCGDEWPEKGFLWHMAQIMRSDEWCPGAEIILHMDSDSIFMEPVTPDDYMKDGKPILLYQSFHHLCDVQLREEVRRWQVATQNCLPFPVLHETMRWLPLIYHRALFPKARELIEQKVGQPMDDYIRKGRNAFPQEFSEHVALGNVALHCFPEAYVLHDLEQKPWPKKKMNQGWSKQGMRREDMDVIKKVGLA